jgi:hypothetical protein
MQEEPAPMGVKPSFSDRVTYGMKPALCPWVTSAANQKTTK